MMSKFILSTLFIVVMSIVCVSSRGLDCVLNNNACSESASCCANYACINNSCQKCIETHQPCDSENVCCPGKICAKNSRVCVDISSANTGWEDYDWNELRIN